MIKLSIYDFGVAHTDFMEDLLEYPYEQPISFDLIDGCFVSEKIDIEKIFLYCKEKYNYTNDDIHYFKNIPFKDILNEYGLYFDVKQSIFIMPIENKKAEKNVICLGYLKKEMIGMINAKEHKMQLAFKYTKYKK